MNILYWDSTACLGTMELIPSGPAPVWPVKSREVYGEQQEYSNTKTCKAGLTLAWELTAHLKPKCFVHEQNWAEVEKEWG